MEHNNPPVMVCLISRQTMQNLLPILRYRPQRVAFITTKEEDDSRRHLEVVLHARQIPADPPCYVDAYAPDATQQVCSQIIEHYGADRLVANLTGGTKVMALAAFGVFSAAHVPCIYTDTPHQRILYLHPDGRPAESLLTTVDVLTYLQAHGQLASLRGRAPRYSLPELAAFLGQHIALLNPFLSRLRHAMRDAPDPTRVRFSPQGKQRHAMAGELVQRAMSAGLVEARQNGAHELEMIFQDDKARRYLEGEWLEDLVFETIRTAGFDSYATNVALAWQDAPEREMNEIDVAVVHKLRFFYLSCKTSSDPEQMKNHLFELETLSELVGGLFNHPILVTSSAGAIPLHLRRRLAPLGITYIGPADLPQLASRLQEIIG
jgi:hypothetical protein